LSPDGQFNGDVLRHVRGPDKGHRDVQVDILRGCSVHAHDATRKRGHCRARPVFESQPLCVIPARPRNFPALLFPSLALPALAPPPPFPPLSVYAPSALEPDAKSDQTFSSNSFSCTRYATCLMMQDMGDKLMAEEALKVRTRTRTRTRTRSHTSTCFSILQEPISLPHRLF